MEKGHQDQHSAFTFIVSSHNNKNIFDADDEYERPRNEGENPEDIVLIDKNPIGSMKTHTESVKGACSDVPINNPQSSDHQYKKG